MKLCVYLLKDFHFLKVETLCLNIKSFAHQRNWLGVQTPELSLGVKK